jgi:hypothetical protein
MLDGFIMQIRCNGTLGKLVHLWYKRDLIAFDLSGYTTFYSSVKQKLTDAAIIFPITALVSDIGIDPDTGATFSVGPEEGWMQFTAPPTDTALGQPIAEAKKTGEARCYVDLFGVDSQGNRVPLGQGDADLLASVTENF